MSQNLALASAFEVQEDSNNGQLTSRPKIDSTPLRESVNRSIIGLSGVINQKEKRLRASTRSIHTQTPEEKIKIHINAVVLGILEMCGKLFSRLAAEREAAKLVTIISEHVNPQYRAYMSLIMLNYGSKDHRSRDYIKEYAFKLADPIFTNGIRDIPVFTNVPESAPNAVMPVEIHEPKKTFIAPKNTFDNAKGAGEEGAREFFDSLQKSRSQLQMAMDFSEMLRIRLSTHVTFTNGKNNDALIAFCEAAQSRIDTNNNSFVVLGNQRYSLKALLSALISNVQQCLERGEKAHEINLKWHTVSEYAALLPTATDITFDESTPIFNEKAQITSNQVNIRKQNPPPLPKIEPDIELEYEDIEFMEDSGTQHKPLSYEGINFFETDKYTPTPAENPETIRRRVIIDQYSTTKKTLADLTKMATRNFEAAKLLVAKTNEILQRKVFADNAKSILLMTAKQLVDIEELTNSLEDSIFNRSSEDTLNSIGEIQIACDEMGARHLDVDAAFKDFAAKTRQYLEFRKAQEEQRQKAHNWLENYFAPGLRAATHGLTYEPIKKSTRGFIKKLMPYVFAAGASIFSMHDNSFTQTEQAPQNTISQPDNSPTFENIGSSFKEIVSSIKGAVKNATMSTSTYTPIRKAEQPEGTAQSVQKEIANNSATNVIASLFKFSPNDAGPYKFMTEEHGKIVSGHIDSEKTAPNQLIVKFEKGEGLSQSAMRIHKELVTAKVTDMLISNGTMTDSAKISQAVEKHIKSLKGIASYSIAMSYIGSSELNDPIMQQFDTVHHNGKKIVNPQGNVNYQQAGNSYSVDVNSDAVKGEVTSSATKIVETLTKEKSGIQKAVSITMSKLGGFAKMFAR